MSISIQYPTPDFKITVDNGQQKIWDEIRKIHVVLTPEEWVRQNFIAYLVRVLQYPQALISVEKQIKVNNMAKRYDIVVYNRQHEPWMLVECKAPEVQLSANALLQAANYQSVLNTGYMIWVNGPSVIGVQTGPKATLLAHLPLFPAL